MKSACSTISCRLVLVAEDDHIIAKLGERALDAFGPLVRIEVPVRRRELLEVVVLEEAKIRLERGGFHFGHVVSTCGYSHFVTTS